MTYTVVLLNGKELYGVTIDQVKELFFQRQINQNSLVQSETNRVWQMLKREFDLTEWIPEASQLTQLRTPAQPIGQIPAVEPQTQGMQSFGNGPEGHTQNNQTQTFYQAESLPAENKLQGIQSNYAPTAVRFEPAAVSSPDQNNGRRTGLRPAAVFILINIVIYLAFVFIGGSAELNSPDAAGSLVGRSIVPIIIDIFLAVKLWTGNDPAGARKWVLVRTYIGFVVSLILPFASTSPAEIAIGLTFGIVGFFYLLAIGLVLHGNKQPSAGRVFAGVGSFAVFLLISVLGLGIAGLGKALPALAKMDLSNPELQQYKIEGSEFQDKTTGAKVSIPEGWTMLTPSNPYLTTPTARMIAIDRSGDRLAMLEVVPVPAELDMRRQMPNTILDHLCDGVVTSMQKQADEEAIFGKSVVRELTRMSVYVGKHPAKLLIVEKSDRGRFVKGHVIITYDDLTFYVLHSWCPTKDYQQSQSDFQYFERSFMVPDDINSPFTQTAENERRK